MDSTLTKLANEVEWRLKSDPSVYPTIQLTEAQWQLIIDTLRIAATIPYPCAPHPAS